MTEQTLSDKRVLDDEVPRCFYWENDVKEFIKKIIAKFKRMEIVSGEVIEFEIRQLAGEKLI